MSNPMTPGEARMARRLASIAAARPAGAGILSRPGNNQRHEPRHPVYRHGRVVVAAGVALECVVIDVSENGARVQLDGALGLPDFVTLKILLSGTARRARVMWRTDNAAGLSFRVEQKTAFAARRLPARVRPPAPVNPETD